jgi:hypothetical protein
VDISINKNVYSLVYTKKIVMVEEKKNDVLTPLVLVTFNTSRKKYI